MAVNILGTVQAQEDGSGGFKLPSATLFNSSIEPLSIIFVFQQQALVPSAEVYAGSGGRE